MSFLSHRVPDRSIGASPKLKVHLRNRREYSRRSIVRSRRINRETTSTAICAHRSRSLSSDRSRRFTFSRRFFASRSRSRSIRGALQRGEPSWRQRLSSVRKWSKSIDTWTRMTEADRRRPISAGYNRTAANLATHRERRAVLFDTGRNDVRVHGRVLCLSS